MKFVEKFANNYTFLHDFSQKLYFNNEKLFI